MKYNSLGKRVGWLILLSVVCVSTISTIALYKFFALDKSDRSLSNTASVPENTINLDAVAALGDLEPKGEVIVLSAPSSAQGARVDQLLVERGEQVQVGQVVAILDNRDRLEANLRKAKEQARVYQARLLKVKAGAQQGAINAGQANIQNISAELRGQIAAQQATIERLEVELRGETAAQQATIERLKAELLNATKDCDRYRNLYKQGAVTEQDRDYKCLEQKTATEKVNEAKVTLYKIISSRREQIVEAQATKKRTVDTLKQRLREAEATLNQTAEVRPVDVAIAQAELRNAQAEIQQAQAELDLAYVRSPKAGQVLKINARAGERVGEKGIVELGQTNRMYVRAEVYETDISRVRVGQKATINSSGFTGKVYGTVEEIGLEVGKKDVLGTDPVADVDARVVEVKIRLEPEDSKKVAGLTNLKVQAVIDTSSVRTVTAK
jgi:ABC exporter DevB family membrane fusion protein